MVEPIQLDQRRTRVRDIERKMLSEVNSVHNEHMQSVTKDLLDARLEVIEARMDGRIAGMSAKLDTALAEMRADRETTNLRFSRMESDLQEVKLAVGTLSSNVDQKVADLSNSVDRRLADSAKAVAEQVKGIKTNIWFGAATTIASVLAAWALAFSAFDSGRETSKSIAEATMQMKQLKEQLEAQAKTAIQPVTPSPVPTQN